jgi:hypothetical protein
MNALRRIWRPAVGAAAVAATAAACSSLSGPIGGSTAPAATAIPASSDGSFTSRVKSFFSGDSARLPAQPPMSVTNGTATELDCPSVEYRQGAATWAVNGPVAESAALSVRYQGSLMQTARECIVSGNNLIIKVGVQGRLVVGPAGSAGTVNVPLRYALVREGLHPQPLWSKLFMVPVTIPPGDLNLTWVHIEEEMTVPRPSNQDLESYVVYIGFDPDGATGAKPKPAPKPKTARGPS